MRDPKFGYHWLWMVPVMALFVIPAHIAVVNTRQAKHWFRMKWILKDPEINELSKLSGIKNDQVVS